MPRMNGTGPEGQGRETGRQMGLCRKHTDEDVKKKLGQGMGLRRKAGGGNEKQLGFGK